MTDYVLDTATLGTITQPDSVVSVTCTKLHRIAVHHALHELPVHLSIYCVFVFSFQNKTKRGAGRVREKREEERDKKKKKKKKKVTKRRRERETVMQR